MSNIVERIGQLINIKGISVRSFEQSIGASNGSIGRAISKHRDISAEWLSKIIDAYPDLNPGWLLTGEGEILKTLKQSISDQNPKIEEDAKIADSTIFNTKTPKNAYKSNVGAIVGERKLRKTPTNTEYPKLDDEELTVGNLADVAGRGMFSKYSDNQILELITARMEKKMLDMYASGRIYSQKSVERLMVMHHKAMSEAQSQIRELQNEVAQLKSSRPDDPATESSVTTKNPM